MVTATKNKIPLILLFGPTGVGKTDLVLDLFEGRGEVVSVDSVQVYRGFDIGSAKPTGEFLKRLPHHLIDICSPGETFNASDFVSLADKACEDIATRDLLPVLSGGTAFYYKNFLYGVVSDLPGEDSRIRGALEERACQEGNKPLWDELVEFDPAYAARIHSNDRLRIIRALEVRELTGRPLSSFEPATVFRDDYDYCLVGLDRDREELYRRIDRRVDIMMDQGLFKEVTDLIENGACEEDPAMKAIGYREFFEMKRRGCLTRTGTADLIKRNSRRYAKRQLTFFRSLEGTRWFHPDRTGDIRNYLDEFLNKHSFPLLT